MSGSRCIPRWLVAMALAGCTSRREPAPAARDAASGPARSTTTWAIRLVDGPGGPPIAGRVLLIDAAGAPVRIGANDIDAVRQAAGTCALAADALGTRDGILLATGVAAIPIGVDACTPSPAIPYGRYQVRAWRGPEHEQWAGEVELARGRGRVETTIVLDRVARLTGVLAADLHVHAAASNDSLVPDPVRVVAQVAAGVQVLALSDHNAAGDLADEIDALGLAPVIASLASNELSGAIHVGVYPWRPIAFDPAAVEASTYTEQLALAATVPGAPVIQLNHPRLRWSALYDDTGWDGVTWPPPFPLAFDAVEVLSGDTTYNAADDRRLDRSIADFYTLVDHGFLVTAVGNSDTHHLNGLRDAVTRNYVAAGWPLAEAEFVDAIRRRRVWATSGPLLEVDVAGAGPGEWIAARAGTRIGVTITLRQARWVVTDTVRVRIGGRRGPELVTELAVPRGARETTWTVEVPVPRGARDTWIGVDAIGDTPLPVEITGSYLAEDGRPGGAPAAIINPILVDVDADHRWTRGDGRVRLVDGEAPVGGRRSLRRKQ